MALAPKLKQLIGQATPPRPFEVEKGQIRRFAAAIGEDDPIHFDEDAARRAGFASLVAPPTFAAAMLAPDAFLQELGWDPQAVMHRAEEYEYFKPIVAGQTLTVTQRLTDLYEQQAATGQLVFAVIESRINDEKDRPVLKGRRVMVRLKS